MSDTLAVRPGLTDREAVEKALDSFAQLRQRLVGSEPGGAWRLCYDQELAARAALGRMGEAVEKIESELAHLRAQLTVMDYERAQDRAAR